MNQSNQIIKLIFKIKKDRTRGLLVYSIKLDGQTFSHYFPLSKQPLDLHPGWLKEKVLSRVNNFTKSILIKVKPNIDQLRNYYSKTSKIFVFKGSKLKSEKKELEYFNTAEERMKEATARRVATRKRNKEQRSNSLISNNDDEVLLRLDNLFKEPAIIPNPVINPTNQNSTNNQSAANLINNENAMES